MSCVTIQNIADTECIGASLPKINGNFAALATATCSLSSSTVSSLTSLNTRVNTLSTNFSSLSSGFVSLSSSFTRSLSSRGYQTLPGGLIMQWGVTGNVAGDSSVTVNFPIPFPNACLNAQVTVDNAGDTWAELRSFTTTTITVGRGFMAGGVNSSAPIYWFTIGY